MKSITFYPKMESKRDVVETIEKIEKVLEKPIMVYVDSIQDYRGKMNSPL